MKAISIALAGAVLLTSGAATAQTATDAQCILLANAFASESKDADHQKAAQAALYFYLGRVSDHTTSAQLKALLDAQAKTLTDATSGPAMNKCIQAIQTKVTLLQSLGGPAPQQPPKK